MFVKAIDLTGQSHTMFEDTDSFKFSYDEHDKIHIVAEDNKFTIFSDEPFEEDYLGQIGKYEIDYEEGKKIYITQASIDVWEFMEV